MLRCLLLFTLFTLVTVNSVQSQTTANQPPNILMIFIDDMGWKDVGFMGSDFYETPTLDRLANKSLVFTNAYSCAANCAPARACLLSGQYTPRHQIYNVGVRPRGKAAHRRLEHVAGVDVLDTKIKTWAHRLKSSGYRTATMGKWHLSNDPIPYGFDINIGGSHRGGPPNGYYPPHGRVAGLSNAPKGEYVTDRLSSEACKFIEANQSQPWMLYLTHFAVHTPLHAKKELVKKYEDKEPGKIHQHVAMGTMIQAVDDGVAEILKTLESTKQSDRTVIMFYSDNGGYGPATDMEPLKGYKGTYYEGGIRVPFFVHWPGKTKPGKTAEPITGVDLYPTFCEIAGIKLPSDQIRDGKSLVPMLQGKRTTVNEDGTARPLFWHFPAYLQSYGARFSAEQRDVLFRSRPCSVIRVGKWKLIQYFESGDLELFDLENDLAESKNLAELQPKKTKELFAQLKAWQRETKAAIPKTKNPKFDADAEATAIKKMKEKAKTPRRGKRKKNR